MALKTREFDPARYLDSEEAVEEFIAAAAESGNPQELARALGIIGRARGITELSKTTGLTRPTLYKALGDDGNPEFATIAKVADALGYRISIVKKETSRSAA